FTVTIDAGIPEKVLFQSSEIQTTNLMRFPKPNIEVKLNRLNVLVVDDSLDNQELIKRILKLAGASVETANNGREGVEMALNGNFSLILMDLQMPEMDGYEATKI